MILKKLDTGDVLRNTIKVYPKNSVFVDISGSQYIKSIGQLTPESSSNSYLISGNPINLSGSGGRYYKSFDTNDVNSSVGLLIDPNKSLVQKYNISVSKETTINHRLSSSMSNFFVTASDATTYSNLTSNTGKTQRYKIISLRNTLNWYASVSPAYDYSRYETNSVSIINIPSAYIGSSIKQGSVELNFYVTGTLIGTLADTRKNGELVQTFPVDSNYTNSAGVVLYNEGLMLLTGSWVLSQSCVDRYLYESSSGGLSYNSTTSRDSPRWIHFGKSMLSGTSLVSSSFEINFEGIDYINTLTIFAHADKDEFNSSNNPTFYKNSNLTGTVFAYTSSTVYSENPLITFANTIKTPYETVSGSFKKQTFINKIGIYDENRKLIAIAKLATPVKKNNERDYTFKLKIDI
jgi:hypothetical protein